MYRLVFCAAAAHTLKYRSCFAYRRASGTPPPYAIGRNILVERRGDVGIAPYGGRKRVSGQMRRGTWPPPYNFRSKELCRAGHTGPATKGALCSYISHRQRRRRRDDTIFKVSCKIYQTCGMCHNYFPMCGARLGSQETLVSCALLVTFPTWEK